MKWHEHGKVDWFEVLVLAFPILFIIAFVTYEIVSNN